MGRALSALQMGILAQAYRNRSHLRALRAVDRRSCRAEPDLPYQQIFAALLGWPMSCRGRESDGPALSKGGAWRFDPVVIGEMRYAAGTAAVSTALRRLARRGLISYEGMRPGGATLTREGVRRAQDEQS
jgi:hypothetical protein